ncbi:clostripain-related cysteine peptidase [Synechococcus sp. UW179A]|uniref:clostripain-related cysteine peptidase n=1 Tax=Synechococcus sp. UW179A TaxID=2575510 RepID=UPI00148326FB|nr:clostripain-related cysteine peptidase [Synechococcus sp. UW179A]
MTGLFHIGHYITSVDLAFTEALKILEMELALAKFADKFSSTVLWDQANGEIGQSNASFPSGWNGEDTFPGGGASQEPWSTTGIAAIALSKASQNDIDFLDKVKDENLNSYIHEHLSNWLKKEIPLRTFGITTEFDVGSEMQTGSADTIDYFLQQTIDQYHQKLPNALILSNHGGGYAVGSNIDGPRWDNDKQEVALFPSGNSFPSVGKVLSKHYSEDNPLDLLFYDSCLMSNIETISAVSDVTRYFLASESVSLSGETNFYKSLRDFQAGLDINGTYSEAAESLGRNFVSKYGVDGHTMSLSDTSYLPELHAACSEFVDAFVGSNDEFISDFLINLEAQGTKFSFYNQDLGNMAVIAKESNNASDDLQLACDSILDALRDVIIVNNNDYMPRGDQSDSEKGSGLTVTFPTTTKHWYDSRTRFYSDIASSFDRETGWSDLLERITPLLPKPNSPKWKMSFPGEHGAVENFGQIFSHSYLDDDTIIFIDYTDNSKIEVFLDADQNSVFTGEDRLIGRASVGVDFDEFSHWDFFNLEAPVFPNSWATPEGSEMSEHFGNIEFIEPVPILYGNALEVNALKFTDVFGNHIADIALTEAITIGETRY